MKKSFKNNMTGEVMDFEVENLRVKVIAGANESKWVAIPRPKYKSRADRRDEAVSELSSLRDELESLKDELDSLEGEQAVDEGEAKLEGATSDKKSIEEEKEALISQAAGIADGVDTSEVESLLDELENWKSGMEGTNLESTSKYQMLDEAVTYLQEAVDQLSSLPSIEDLDSIEEVINYLDDVISNLESVEFPGMYS